MPNAPADTLPVPHLLDSGPGFAADCDDAVPVHLVAPDQSEAALAELGADATAWAMLHGFSGAGGTALVLPGANGAARAALIGTGTADQRDRGRFLVAGGAAKLATATYRLTPLAAAPLPTGADLDEAVLGWLLETYRFGRYRTQTAHPAMLIAPADVDVTRLIAIAKGECLTRDLINTPPNDMGPAEIEIAARALALAHDATCSVITGDDLLAQNYPMIHAVGRAAAPHRAPRLIVLDWGTQGPALTLVGKGVCFDTGGLDIKPAASMGLMKKDMGGAATVLGLAHMIMATGQNLRLRVLIPAVENAIGSDAFRPQDILTARNGRTVEINNTDAEGRLVLADALALAAETPADLTISMATLTGAARVAVGGDIAPFFAQNDADAAAVAAGAAAARDPVWRLPFHAPYEKLIEPGIADLDNAPGGGMAGAITAALFLRRFAPARYMHFDIYGWQAAAAPARPKGGVGQGARAIFAALPALLAQGGPA